jgi:TonB family protein
MTSRDLVEILWLATWVGSLAILVVLALRAPVRRRCGAGVSYALWWLVTAAWLALLLPAREVPTSTAWLALPAMAQTESVVPATAAWDLSPLWLALWLVGAIAMAVRLWRQQCRFVRGLGTLQPLAGDAGVLQAQSSAGLPALVGFLRPRIVMPADVETRYDAEQRALILAHERIHLRRGDLWVNALVSVLRAVFWCNPLVHLAAGRLRHDQELACDERIVAARPQSRRVYADTMFKTLMAAQPAPLGCHWGITHPLKERIMLLRNERPSRRVRIAGMALVGVAMLATGLAVWAAQPAKIKTLPGTADADFSARIEFSENGGDAARFMAGKRFGERFTMIDADTAGRPSITASVQPVRVEGELAYDIAMRIERSGKTASAPRVVVRDGEHATVRQGNDVDGRFDGIQLDVTVSARDREAALARAKPFVVPSAPVLPPPAVQSTPVEPLPPPPRYPQAALEQGISGKVVLIVDVAADGSVAAAKVERADPAGVFDSSALETVKKWRFKPATKDGKPIASRIRVPIEWRADG